MPSFLPRTLLFSGAVLLIHACYSAHEYSSLVTLSSSARNTPPTAPPLLAPHFAYPPSSTAANNSSSSGPSTSTSPSSSLPLDITIETLISVLLICVGLVFGADELRPISWRVWAGRVEMGTAGEGVEGYMGLERGRRKGFVDVRAQREGFAGWVKGREGAGGEK